MLRFSCRMGVSAYETTRLRDDETTSIMGPRDYDGTTRWMEGGGSLASLLQVVRVGAARKGVSNNQPEQRWLDARPQTTDHRPTRDV